MVKNIHWKTRDKTVTVNDLRENECIHTALLQMQTWKSQNPREPPHQRVRNSDSFPRGYAISFEEYVYGNSATEGHDCGGIRWDQKMNTLETGTS